MRPVDMSSDLNRGYILEIIGGKNPEQIAKEGLRIDFNDLIQALNETYQFSESEFEEYLQNQGKIPKNGKNLSTLINGLIIFKAQPNLQESLYKASALLAQHIEEIVQNQSQPQYRIDGSLNENQAQSTGITLHDQRDRMIRIFSLFNDVQNEKFIQEFISSLSSQSRMYLFTSFTQSELQCLWQQLKQYYQNLDEQAKNDPTEGILEVLRNQDILYQEELKTMEPIAALRYTIELYQKKIEMLQEQRWYQQEECVSLRLSLQDQQQLFPRQSISSQNSLELTQQRQYSQEHQPPLIDLKANYQWPACKWCLNNTKLDQFHFNCLNVQPISESQLIVNTCICLDCKEDIIKEGSIECPECGSNLQQYFL